MTREEYEAASARIVARIGELRDEKRTAYATWGAMGFTSTELEDLARGPRADDVKWMRLEPDAEVELRRRPNREGIRRFARAGDLAGAVAWLRRVEADIASAREERRRLYRRRPREGEPRRTKRTLSIPLS